MLSMAFALCACGNGADANTENKNTETENTQDSQTTDADTETVEDGKITYRVFVVDEGGNPVANAMVQVCDDATCFAPAATNEAGIAEFSLVKADGYKTKLVVDPAGYESIETDYVSFESGETEIVLTIRAIQ